MTQENTPSPPTEPQPSILDEQDFQDFIEDREIAPEDIKILEYLSQFPKSFFLDFHNFFNLSKGNSLQLLDSQRERLNLEQDESSQLQKKKKFLDLLYAFAEKYHWMTCWNMITVFERREN